MMADGGPAFPHTRSYSDRKGYTENDNADGMSLRDWFAGQALAGFMAAGKSSGWGLPPKVAQQAYEFADAMLKEREK